MSRRELDRMMDNLCYESDYDDDDVLDGLALGNYEDSYNSRYGSFRNDWNEYIHGWN